MEKINVLVVDDEEIVLMVIKRFLNRNPIFDVETAVRGHQALDMAGKKAYDALVCDIGLPDMEGTEIVEEMKAKRICPGLVIFMSGIVSAMPKNMLGNMFFIRKPLNPSELTSLLIEKTRDAGKRAE